MIMNIRYNRKVSIAFIVLGVVLACLYLVIVLSGGKAGVLLTLAVVIIFFGLIFLNGTYFILNENSLVLKALIGPASITYRFDSFKDFSIENNSLFLNQNGKRQKINISVWLVDEKGWQAF